MAEIGQLAIKIAGREAGKECIIVDVINNTSVLIDGNVKRRNCNIRHLELSSKIADVKKGASTEQVKEALKNFGIEVKEKTAQKEEKKPTPKPAKERKIKGKKALSAPSKSKKESKIQ